ncbi:hypothetical protein FTUN_0670 [Frigoriglobus tundricola]|uniref:Uncharacterized protein n=1 Tax=Frigoriglobus tundricola TaxID=2774151 RepID=A0A6M5YGM2_9BACT|nr:hypothetical protein FTUN_0670 [Frigoriglobus tundricola]
MNAPARSPSTSNMRQNIDTAERAERSFTGGPEAGRRVEAGDARSRA